MTLPSSVCWPLDQLSTLVESLAHASGLSAHPRKAPTPPNPEQANDRRILDNWLRETANWLGFEVEPVSCLYPDIEEMIKRSAPGIFLCEGNGTPYFIGIKRSLGNKLKLIAADRRTVTVTLDEVRQAVCTHVEAAHRAEIERLISTAGIGNKGAEQAERELFREFLRDEKLPVCFLFRASPATPFLTQIRKAGLGFNVAMLFASYTLKHLLWVGAWWLVADTVFSGRFDLGFAIIWVLMFLAVGPINMITNWNQGLVSIGFGSLLKRRLLFGSTRLEPEEIRGLGYGGLLARVLESGALESVTLVTAINSSFAVIDLVVALLALMAGAVMLPAVFLVLWIIPVIWLCTRFVRIMKGWTETRVAMTDDLVERLSGHRTRLAQERRNSWHDEEDWHMERYLEQSETMDKIKSICFILLPYGWLLIGLCALGPALIQGTHGKEVLALSFGGIFLAFSAFTKLIKSGIYNLALTYVAWGTIRDLFHAATRKEKDTPPVTGLLPATGPGNFGGARTIVSAHDLIYSYDAQLPPILKGVSLKIEDGDRILLRGGSGSGKSTLASLLLGLRQPQAGLVLLHGLDRHSLGPDAWRGRITSAPQYHDNHIYHGSLAYNLLMGRRWPATADDLALAEEICRELGLGPLLDRMPAGLMQAVGDSGWRLSNGECSRIFIARALLQNAEFIIFDESFGTLDPESMHVALACVFKRARSLMIIAHP